MFKIINGIAPTYVQDIFASKIGRSVYNGKTSRYNLKQIITAEAWIYRRESLEFITRDENWKIHECIQKKKNNNISQSPYRTLVFFRIIVLFKPKYLLIFIFNILL